MGGWGSLSTCVSYLFGDIFLRQIIPRLKSNVEPMMVVTGVSGVCVDSRGKAPS